MDRETTFTRSILVLFLVTIMAMIRSHFDKLLKVFSQSTMSFINIEQKMFSFSNICPFDSNNPHTFVLTKINSKANSFGLIEANFKDHYSSWAGDIFNSVQLP